MSETIIQIQVADPVVVNLITEDAYVAIPEKPVTVIREEIEDVGDANLDLDLALLYQTYKL